MTGPAREPTPLAEIETWIFDLDNTLYPAALNLFDQVDRLMGRFIAERLGLGPEEARALQKRYFRQHGTTLRGLMDMHDIDPHAFLDYVHEIDLSALEEAPRLDRALGRLAGRKIVYTNGSVAHADRILERLGVARHFETIVDIVGSAFVPKPKPEAYAALVAGLEIRPDRAAMVEDIARNLKPAADLGMTTVWVPGAPGWAVPEDTGDYIHHVAEDLPEFLEGVVTEARASLGS